MLSLSRQRIAAACPHLQCLRSFACFNAVPSIPRGCWKNRDRGGQNLTERYTRLENTLRGKNAFAMQTPNLFQEFGDARSLPSASATPSFSGQQRTAGTIAGFIIPQEPIPPADEECCMSGCAVCVYDLYEESLEDYKKSIVALRSSLSALSIPESAWPAHVRTTANTQAVQNKLVILDAFEQMERQLKEKRAAVEAERELLTSTNIQMFTPFKSFSLSNNIFHVSPQDEIYAFDVEANRKINREAPWDKDPHYFKSCKISAVALIKMESSKNLDIFKVDLTLVPLQVIHARSGVPHEIMGLMQGKVMGNSLVIMDSFALPVQGTETRVNAANEANEYMVKYIQESEKAKRLENAIGWYHSHPGYGCWLSGIDVDTQMNNQQFQDPFVAVVIDPNRTISAGKVDIGAFRTYPANYTPPIASASEYQSIPLNKIEDFGVHANQYYPLDVEVFKSSLDTELLSLLWNKYWVNTLSQSPLISNRAYAVSQIVDLHQKLYKAQASVSSTRAPIPTLKGLDEKASSAPKKEEKKKEDNQLAKGMKDSTKIAAEAQHGLISQVLKDIVFSSRPSQHAGDNRVTEIVDIAMTVE